MAQFRRSDGGCDGPNLDPQVREPEIEGAEGAVFSAEVGPGG